MLADYAAGELSEHDVCDAHPELRRAAAHSAQPVGDRCPICSDGNLVYVTYAFGPRLPKSGRCLLSTAEVDKLRTRKGLLSYYVVEVCPHCSWNHLSRTFTTGGDGA